MLAPGQHRDSNMCEVITSAHRAKILVSRVADAGFWRVRSMVRAQGAFRQGWSSCRMAMMVQSVLQRYYQIADAHIAQRCRVFKEVR
jgi:hypothetical protein